MSQLARKLSGVFAAGSAIMVASMLILAWIFGVVILVNVAGQLAGAK